MADWADEYVGLRYKAGGRNRSGLDCWGLVLLVLRERFGIDVPVYSGVTWSVATSADVARKIEQERVGWTQIDAGQERPGDVILMRLRGYPIHVGIVLGDGMMLHAHDGADVTREPYQSVHWRHRIVGFYRHA